MLKVFTTSSSSDLAGDELTRLFNEWRESLSCEIKINKVHSNSNQSGWMLVITYEQSLSTEKWSN